MQLYHESLYRYAGLTSPYIYPRYGLGELPQARGAPLWGGVLEGGPCGWFEGLPSRATGERRAVVGRKERDEREWESGRGKLAVALSGGAARAHTPPHLPTHPTHARARARAARASRA